MKKAPPSATYFPWLGKLNPVLLLFFFSAIASAQSLSIVSGNGQLICSYCPTASFAFDPLVVMLKDARGVPVPNATVTWTIKNPASVAGKVFSTTTFTGADGSSTNTFTLSPPLQFLQSFVQATVTATSMGSSVTFTETNSAPASGTGVDLVGLELVSPPSGTVLTGTPGSIAAVPVKISVRSFTPGGPVQGVEVRLVSDPNQPATAVCAGSPVNSVLTDANGSAVCNVQFGNGVGDGRYKVYIGGSFGTYGYFRMHVDQGGGGPGPGSGAGQLSATPSSLTFQYPGSAPLTQMVSVASTSGTVNYTAAVQVTLAAVTWLTVGQPSGPAGTTPGTFPVTINPQTFPPGIYRAVIDIHPDNGTADLAIPVQLTIQAAGTPGQLTATPSALTFQYPGPLAQTVTIGSTGSSVTYTAAVSPAVTWLTVSPPTGPTSGTSQSAFQVSIVPQSLPPGTSHANIVVHPNNGTGDLTVPVQATVVPGQLTATPALLTFQYPGALTQTVSVGSTGGSVNYTAAVQITLAAVTWLTVGSPTGPASGAAQSSFAVTIVPQSLTPGTYRAAVAVHPDNGSADVVVPVQLVVGSGGGQAQLTTTPASLTFQYPGAVTQAVAVGSTGAALNYTASVQAATPPATWLTVGPLGGSASSTTQSTLQVTVAPQSLAPGTYRANITLHPDNGSADLTIPVQVAVQQTGVVAQLTANPGSLIFQSSGTLSQTVAVGSTSGSVTYSAVVQPPVAWLAVGSPPGPASNTALSVFQVIATPQSLPPATYQAVIVLHPSNGAPDLTIPVQVIVPPPAIPSVSIFPGNLSLSQLTGGIVSSAAAISITSSGVPVQFSAATNANWLSVFPASGTTPGQVAISVNATGLAPGNYTGTVNITVPGAANGVQAVAISLAVQSSQSLSLSVNSLTFTSQTGLDAPPSQTVSLTPSSGSLSFSAVAASLSPQGVNWLSVSPSAGTAANPAANLVVSVNPTGLAPGTYIGTINLSAPNASNRSQTVVVTYVITSLPTPVLTRISNAGSNVNGPVSPGEIVSISGHDLGPATAVATAVTGGFVQKVISETQVTFDNIPASLMLVSASQINAVVPYAIAGRASTRVVVMYKSSISAAFTLDIADAAPGIFTDSSGQGNIFNEDGSANGPGSPAHPGSAIVIFATGEGATVPSGTDGLITPLDPAQWKQPILSVTATIGGIPAQVVYAGSAPELVSGMLQVNVVVPDNAPIGIAVPVVITVGTTDSPIATMAIQ